MIRLGILAGLLAATAVPAASQTIAITNGIIAKGDGSDPEQGGTVVMRSGRIVAAGAGVSIPAGAQVFDAQGKWVTPGIVAGFSRLGLAEVDLSVAGSDDTNANGPFSAAIDVVPAINPLATTIANSRADGVTRAIVAPSISNSIFAGQGAVIDTGADMDPVTSARRFQFVELGEAGAAAAGGSRASAHVLFRNALREAAELRRFDPVRSTGQRNTADILDQPIVRNPNKSRIYGPDARRSEDVLLTRFDAAALVPVVQGRQYLLVHVERASDILQVLGLKREFPSLKLVLVGVTEGWTVAGDIAAAGVAVIASGVNDLPGSFEQLAATQSNVGRMRAAGVKVSIGLINDNDTRYMFAERQYAGNLVALSRLPGATGLTWGEALRAITSAPAEAIGMGRELGSLAAGRRADVVIWSGDPLESSSAAEAVFIDGVRQPLETHQSKLRDRYRSLERSTLPEAYPALTPKMGLFFGAIAFLATHFLMSHPFRAPLVRRFGTKGFQGLYSLVAIILFGVMIWSYHGIGRERQAWEPTEWAYGLGAVLMWVGAVLFMGSFAGNPALPGASGPRGGPKGVFTITRHPMMWGFAFWAITHILIIAQPKAVMFYGAILLLALVGSALQDRKKAGLMGDTWHEWTAQTAFIPFTRGLAYPGTFALVAGTLLYLGVTWLHPEPVEESLALDHLTALKHCA